MKLEPLASWVRQQSKNLYLPASQVAVDEMMVRFGGRSKHTVKMPNKPISEGYKIFALCDRGYTYDFTFYSPCTGYSYVLKHSSELTPTANMVYALATSLPYKQYRFDIYMDNFFTNVPLLRALLHEDIGAIGTVRPTSAEFPSSLNINKDEARKSLSWNHLCGDVVDENILVLLWQDNNSVLLMSTIHDPSSYTIVRRRKPRATSTNAVKAREPFGPAHELNLPIPSIIDDYNQYMNGVDIADHLRSNYSTQLTSHRTWMPLFYWLLDTVVINSYRIYQQAHPQSLHKDFREALVKALTISEAPPKLQPHSSTTSRYVTSLSNPHPRPFRLAGSHSQTLVAKNQRRQCWLCRYKACWDRNCGRL